MSLAPPNFNNSYYIIILLILYYMDRLANTTKYIYMFSVKREIQVTSEQSIIPMLNKP